MNSKGLSHYQQVQKNSERSFNDAALEQIMEKGALYNIHFLQNRALMQAVLELPECEIEKVGVDQIEALLLWLFKTQEEARVS